MIRANSTHAEQLDWDEVSDIFANFCIWSSRAEMRWFKRAWERFAETGSTSYSNDADRHWVLTKAVTLGIMFNRFAQIAWEEEHDVEPILYDLQDHKNTFSMIRIGNMAARESLSDWGEDPELFVQAMQDLIRQCRPEVYRNLVRVFGNPKELFASLWLSNDSAIEIGDYSKVHALLHEDRDVEPGLFAAYDYVNNGMND